MAAPPETPELHTQPVLYSDLVTDLSVPLFFIFITARPVRMSLAPEHVPPTNRCRQFVDAENKLQSNVFSLCLATANEMSIMTIAIYGGQKCRFTGRPPSKPFVLVSSEQVRPTAEKRQQSR